MDRDCIMKSEGGSGGRESGRRQLCMRRRHWMGCTTSIRRELASHCTSLACRTAVPAAVPAATGNEKPAPLEDGQRNAWAGVRRVAGKIQRGDRPRTPQRTLDRSPLSPFLPDRASSPPALPYLGNPLPVKTPARVPPNYCAHLREQDVTRTHPPPPLSADNPNVC
ncbi:hypothetical protein C8Q77DRAFT_704676 [Trametes polyzona]|nr:hypothetical protein C8Q77DRAFT_704676 [Trametes polyzona]